MDVARYVPPMLSKLLGAWEKEKSEELRSAVLALDAASKRPPFEGTTAEWAKRAAKADEDERGALFLALKGPKVIDTQQRLEHCRHFPPDPRLNAAVEALLAEVPYSADSSKPVWRAAFELVTRSQDARFTALARELPAKWKVRALMKTWLESAFARAIEGLPSQSPAASPATQKLLAQLGELPAPAPKVASSGKTEAALLEAVYQRPFDDAPRRAYADFLLERGDERGELIALQLSGEDEPRQQALLEKHGKKWLGPLAPVLGKHFEFRRGFLAVAMVKFRHQADAERYGPLPEWATVEELTWSHPNPIPQGQEPHCLFAGPHMRGLTLANGAWVPHLLAAKEPWAIETLVTHAGGPDHLAALLASPLLPKLRRLELHAVDGTWLHRLEWPERIECLALPRYTRTRDVLSGASALKLARLELGEERVFTRGSDGALSKLRVKHQGLNPPILIEMAALLPDGALESVEFDREKAPKGFEATEAAFLAKVKKPGQASTLPAAGTVRAGPQPFDKLEGVQSMIELEGGTLLSVAQSRLAWVDPEKKLLRSELPVAHIGGGGLTPDGRLLLWGHKKVELRDPATGELTKSGTLGITQFMGLSFAAGRVSFGARVFDLQQAAEVPAPRGAGNLILLAPDLSCWVKWVAADRTYALHPGGARKGVSLEHATSLRSPLFLNGVLFAATNERLCAWELATGRLLRSRAVKASPLFIVVSPDRKRLLVQVKAGAYDVVDLATFETVASLPWPGPALPTAGAFSRDGRSFYVISKNELQRLPITT